MPAFRKTAIPAVLFSASPVVKVAFTKRRSHRIKHGLPPWHASASPTSVSRLGRLMPRPKNQLPRKNVQGVAYQIPCAECSASYTEETKIFCEQLRRQKNDVQKFDRERSAVAEHCEDLDLRIDFANPRVLDVEPDIRKRLFLLSWRIRHTPGNVNRYLGASPTVYAQGLRHLPSRAAKLTQKKKTRYLDQKAGEKKKPLRPLAF